MQAHSAQSNRSPAPSGSRPGPRRSRRFDGRVFGVLLCPSFIVVGAFLVHPILKLLDPPDIYTLESSLTLRQGDRTLVLLSIHVLGMHGEELGPALVMAVRHVKGRDKLDVSIARGASVSFKGGFEVLKPIGTTGPPRDVCMVQTAGARCVYDGPSQTLRVYPLPETTPVIKTRTWRVIAIGRDFLEAPEFEVGETRFRIWVDPTKVYLFREGPGERRMTCLALPELP